MEIQLYAVRYNPDTEEYLWDTKTLEGEFDLRDQDDFMSYMMIKESFFEKYGKTVAFIELHQ